MATVKVQKVPEAAGPPPDEIVALFCYYYQQYTFAVARNMPYKRVAMMIKIARRKEAEHYYNLTQIVAAPHSEKGKGVKTLEEHYKKLSQG